MKKQTRVDWPRAAEMLARALPAERLHPAVLAWAGSRPAREKWGVAFSGGADSLALLLLLWAHFPQRRRHLVALHFDHRLRGRESRADAVFCRRIGEALDVGFVAGAWTEAQPGASEAEARDARMKFLGKHARVVWLGHQMDDIAETMLMRLACGSGTSGLAAPRPVQVVARSGVHVRPLLALKKSEIVVALRAAAVPWREDSTNQGIDYFRNRIRRNVLPAWAAAAQRDAVGGAALARARLEEDDTALEAWLDELAPLRPDGSLDLEPLANKPRAVVRRALYRWLLRQPTSGKLSRQGFEGLLAAVARGARTRYSLGLKGFAVIRSAVLRFEPVGKHRREFQRSAN